MTGALTHYMMQSQRRGHDFAGPHKITLGWYNSIKIRCHCFAFLTIGVQMRERHANDDARQVMGKLEVGPRSRFPGATCESCQKRWSGYSQQGIENYGLSNSTWKSRINKHYSPNVHSANCV